MKKIIIRSIDNRLIAYIDEVKPTFPIDDQNAVIAVFDVSECLIRC